MLDVAVIGGGISGVAIAWRLAEQGYSVRLLERNRLGQATSHSSLRIMHGGIRYLQHLDIARSIQSLRDQQWLHETFPGELSVLPCVLRLSWSSITNPAIMAVFGTAYDLLRLSTLPRHSSGRRWTTGIGRARDEAPLKPGEWIFRWQDLVLKDPDRLVAALAEKARLLGVTISEGHAVTEVTIQPDSVVVHGNSELVSKVVVNASGAWIRSIQGVPPNVQPPLSWCRAFNVILNRSLGGSSGVGLFGAQGRAFFFVPRGDRTAIGTEYLPLVGDAASASITSEEISTFLDEVNRASGLSLSERDVAEVEAGVLPCLPRDSCPPGRASERGAAPKLLGSEIIGRYGRYVEVVSTKYTTFDSQARQVAAEVAKVLEAR